MGRAAHRHVISHTQSVREHTASVSSIFHDYFLSPVLDVMQNDPRSLFLVLLFPGSYQ